MNFRKLHNDERGIVSIVVTMIIMIILTLVVVGFAQLSRREQEQSLDRQLNSQAFYAAESAVNDVRQLFEAGTVDLTRDFTTTCEEFITTYGLNTQVDSATGTLYSCLFVDPSPVSLVFSPVNTTSSQVFPLQSRTGEAISSVTFNWQPADPAGHNQATCPSVNTATYADAFPPSWPNDCQTGILRVDLVPYNGAQTVANLINNTFTAFLYPHTAAGALTYATGVGPANAGAIRSGGCNASGQCSLTITGLNSAVNYVRMRSIYQSNNVTVTARNAANAVLELSGAQATVDSTGKATDVLRRIQVRLDVDRLGGAFPEFGLQSNDTLCKQYGIAPPSTVILPGGADAAACTVD